MSGRRRRDALAPSLFPFLAVLLCTMGSLVLILMLIVSGAQEDAKSIAQEAEVRKAEIESLAEHSVRSFQEQLEEGRLELEEERLVLQHYEDHILELQEELEDLEKTAQQLENEKSEISDEDYEEQLSELEKQLAKAAKKLKQKLDKPDGDKPVFAVIPYEGPNGTHRRPIYLECTDAGIIVQPEGNLLSLTDLQPPYGPGNPLDAALRAIRAEYKPENGAITHTAYPLLLVRPTGVGTYMMARAAMRGWDDQFGYELIAGDLELIFPDGEPGLRDKIAKSINLARQRQEALAMAMPRKYQGRSYQPLDGTQSFTSRNSGSNWNGNSQSGSQGYGSDNPEPPTGSSSNSSGTGFGGGHSSISSNTPYSSKTGDGRGITDQPPTQANPLAFDSGAADTALGNSFFGNQSGSGDRYFGSGGPSSGGPSSSSGGYGMTDPNSLGSSSVGDQTAGDQTGHMSGQAPNADSSRAADTASNRYANLSGNANAGTTAYDASASGNAANGGPNGEGPNSKGPSSGSGSSSRGSATTSRPGSMQGAAGGSSQQQDSDGSPSTMGPPQLSLDLSKQRELDETRPVAARRGRNWAWSNRNNTRTAVVRPVRLQCFEDRWVLLPDRTQDQGRNRHSAPSLTIPFDGTPQQRTEYLVEAIHRRVDDWGMAVTGGYWKPKLIVDVAPDAQWRYVQLVRLLEGSGLELERRSSQIAKPGVGPASNAGGFRR